MLAIKLRYNTECTDNILFWRVLINGQEQLASEVRANVPSQTTRDVLDDGRTKFHVTYYCKGYTWEGTVLVLS